MSDTDNTPQRPTIQIDANGVGLVCQPARHPICTVKYSEFWLLQRTVIYNTPYDCPDCQAEARIRELGVRS